LLTFTLDKAHPDKKDEAHTIFQEIAFAYAVLSDPIRKKRYDVTGSTAESISIDDDFSWSDFYAEQYRDIITPDAIEMFSRKYKGSDEEKDDIINAYTKFKGNMGKLYQVVILSNPLDDEERFRVVIDEAIASGDVEAFKAYTEETEASKEKRMQKARREAKEAEKLSQELKAKREKKEKKQGGDDSLAAIIRSRQAGRMGFLDKLEAKYAAEEKPKRAGKKAKGKGKKVQDEDEDDDVPDMPTEEEFQAAAAKLKRGSPTDETEAAPKVKRSKRTRN